MMVFCSRWVSRCVVPFFLCLFFMFASLFFFFPPILPNVSYQLSDKLRVYKNGKPTFCLSFMHCVSFVGGFSLCLYLCLFQCVFFSLLLLRCHTFDSVPMTFFPTIRPAAGVLVNTVSFSFGCFHFSFVFAFCTPMTNKNLEGGANLYKQFVLLLTLASKVSLRSLSLCMSLCVLFSFDVYVAIQLWRYIKFHRRVAKLHAFYVNESLCIHSVSIYSIKCL